MSMCVCVCLRTHLVDLTFLANGSNETVMRFTAFKLTALTFFAMNESTPPGLLNKPLWTIDISHDRFQLFDNSSTQTCTVYNIFRSTNVIRTDSEVMKCHLGRWRHRQ